MKYYINASDMIFAKMYRKVFAPDIDISRSLLAADESKYLSNWSKLIHRYFDWREEHPLIIL